MTKIKKNSSKSEKSNRDGQSSIHESIKPVTSIQLTNIPGGMRNIEVHCPPKRLPKCPSHLPQLPCLLGAFGVCRSGKTNAVVNLIAEYWKHKSINLLYCISPTYDSNACLQTLPFVDERTEEDKKKDAKSGTRSQGSSGFVGIFTNSDNAVESLITILNHIKTKKNEWDYEEEYKLIYKKYLNPKKHYKLNIRDWDILHREKFREPKEIPWPCPAIFIDDMTHTELMTNTINNKLSHLSLHHRHLDGVGVSIFQAFQTFKSGMPKVVRANISLIMIFGTCNLQEIEEMYKEVSNNVCIDTFKYMLFEATKEPHSFLMIDKMNKDPQRQFGINFDRSFVVDIVAERAKLLANA